MYRPGHQGFPDILARFARLRLTLEPLAFDQRKRDRVACVTSRDIPPQLIEFTLEVMPLHRRFAALLTGLFLLQFVLVGSGFACATDEVRGGSAMTAMDDMAAMGMGSADQAQTEDSSAADGTPEQPCGAPVPGDDCGDPGSSEACTAMTSCALPALSVDRTAFAERSPSHQDTPSGRVIPPPSRSTAPDHPPPRA